MAHKEDLRIIKTKNSLTNAFFAMLNETSIEDITVNDLCERAGVRRATFYKHFADKNDFLNFLIRDIRESFDKEFLDANDHQTLTKEYHLKYVQTVVSFLQKHEDAIRKILLSPMRAAFIDVFMRQNYIDTRIRLEKSIAEGMTIPASAPVVASMLIGGVSHNILRWFESDSRESINELINDISNFIDYILK